MSAPTANRMRELLAIMQRLRDECPWDRAQTPHSLTRYAIEEAYEVEAAIRAGNTADICDELGDLLLQVVFQARMFEQQGAFNFDDVVNGLMAKMIRRHPHIFAQQTAIDTQAVSQQWDAIKQAERGGVRRRLDDIKAGAALMQAQNLQKQAAKVGFDWPDLHGAQQKLNEELAELDAAIASQDPHAMADELGDCFFSLVNVARKLNIDSESATLGTVYKFRQRFAFIEDRLAEQGKNPDESDLAELDALWEQAKHFYRQVGQHKTQPKPQQDSQA